MLIACDSIRRARPLLGTFVEIAAAGAAPDKMNRAVAAAFAAVATVHDLMSFHEAGSDVSRLNTQAWTTAVCVHPWTFQVLQMATDLHVRSAGVFDVAIAPVLQDMGLLPRPSRGGLSASRNWATAQAIELLPGYRIRFQRSGMRIDLGGIAKGFAVDCAVDALRAYGIAAGTVNAGGDLAAFGPNAQIVALRDPRNPRRSICRVPVNNAALASSGLLFDPVEAITAPYSAIINPITCQPVNAICGATVRASCCWIADALTKVVMVAGTGSSEVLDFYGASALLVMANGEVLATPSWQDACCIAT